MLSSLFNEKKSLNFSQPHLKKEMELILFFNNYFRYIIDIFHIIIALLILIIKAAVFLMLTTFAYLSTDYDSTTADKRQ